MGTTQIERVIPLKEAASRMGISVAALTRLVSDGMIRAVQLPDGSMAVSEQELVRDTSDDQFSDLRGKPILISEAAKKYAVPGNTIRRWIKHRYIRVVGDGYPLTLDEADVARCAQTYQERKQSGSVSGAPLFDEAGRPYQLKYPDVSEYRKRRRETTVRGYSSTRPSTSNKATLKVKTSKTHTLK